MSKKKKNVYETPKHIQEKINYLDELLKKENKVLAPTKWYQKTIPMSEKLEYIRSISRTRTEIWAGFYSAFPELKGKALEYKNAYEVHVKD